MVGFFVLIGLVFAFCVIDVFMYATAMDERWYVALLERELSTVMALLTLVMMAFYARILW